MRYFIIISLCIFCLPFLGFAQQFEIRAVNAGDGIIRIEMKEISGISPSASDFLTDLVFWD